jgi:membrane-bound ClpP family serine protease
MDSVAIIALLYAAGLILVVAEVFVPSHGLLTIGSLVCFGIAIQQTFERTTTGGAIGLVSCLLVVPTVLLLGIKNVHRLPMGDKLAPPHPELSARSAAVEHDDCAALIGRTGKCITPLRPVGIGEFDGRRVSCVAEAGMIDAGEAIVGVDVHLSNLAVRRANGESKTT